MSETRENCSVVLLMLGTPVKSTVTQTLQLTTKQPASQKSVLHSLSRKLTVLMKLLERESLTLGEL